MLLIVIRRFNGSHFNDDRTLNLHLKRIALYVKREFQTTKYEHTQGDLRTLHTEYNIIHYRVLRRLIALHDDDLNNTRYRLTDVTDNLTMLDLLRRDKIGRTYRQVSFNRAITLHTRNYIGYNLQIFHYKNYDNKVYVIYRDKLSSFIKLNNKYHQYVYDDNDEYDHFDRKSIIERLCTKRRTRNIALYMSNLTIYTYKGYRKLNVIRRLVNGTFFSNLLTHRVNNITRRIRRRNFERTDLPLMSNSLTLVPYVVNFHNLTGFIDVRHTSGKDPTLIGRRGTKEVRLCHVTNTRSGATTERNRTIRGTNRLHTLNNRFARPIIGRSKGTHVTTRAIRTSSSLQTIFSLLRIQRRLTLSSMLSQGQLIDPPISKLHFRSFTMRNGINNLTIDTNRYMAEPLSIRLQYIVQFKRFTCLPISWY